MDDRIPRYMDGKEADSSSATPRLSMENVPKEMDSEMDKRITRKIDIRLVPMLCMLYLTAYLDRTNIGNAKLYGLEKELHMPSNGYNTAIWVFYLTFVVMEVPSNLLMAHTKVPPHYWLGASMSLLGVVTMCQGFVKTPGALYACRTLMGVFEGSLTPAAALMMGSYYRKHEFPVRYACFTTSALIGGSFSSFLAYAINFMDGTAGISSWRWIFILEGIFNICIALCTFFILPRFPAESTFLAPAEKQHLLDRLSTERGDEAESFKGQPWLSFLLDWQTWLNIVIYFGADMSAAAISQFSPTILKQMGFTSNAANLRNIPVWLVGALVAITTNIAAGKWGIPSPSCGMVIRKHDWET
ncbi:hypothetical protein EG327_008097 [Venturia inaequalis]|uniref:Major facilitator superfamily (MFS) profile domain-containing protein n=1 Tax=Venturia inaequalis TaxID=5025 RepID=A0A8H3ZD06_VENIN|nr:hypothetical protein EG327_008097 [Venturia inaequalis]